MFLETLTLIMLVVVIALKYGAVSRIVRLNQKFRDADNICKRHESILTRKRSERKLVERDETNFTRQQVGLESEMKRLDEELTGLKAGNAEVLKELLPAYKGSEEELMKSVDFKVDKEKDVSKN